MKKITFHFVYGVAIFKLLVSSLFTYKMLVDDESNALMVLHTQRDKNKLAFLSDELRSFSSEVKKSVAGLTKLTMIDLAELKNKSNQTYI